VKISHIAKECLFHLVALFCAKVIYYVPPVVKHSHGKGCTVVFTLRLLRPTNHRWLTF